MINTSHDQRVYILNASMGDVLKFMERQMRLLANIQVSSKYSYNSQKSLFKWRILFRMRKADILINVVPTS